MNDANDFIMNVP